MQNERLRWGCRKCGIWPCETYTIFLDVEPLNQMWAQLSKKRDIHHYFDKPTKDSKTWIEKEKGYRLENVCYWDKSLKTIVEKTSWKVDYNWDRAPWFSRKGSELDLNKYYQSDKFYFSNASLIKGLLVMGKMQKLLPEWWLENAIYFKDSIGFPPTIYGFPYDDIIQNNAQVRQGDLTVNDVTDWLQDLMRRQTLIKIHKNIQLYKMPYLNTKHEKEILDILREEKPLEENMGKILKEYLPNLRKRYQDQQSYLSGAGWADTFYYKEWKK
jgi:hypothetical protein